MGSWNTPGGGKYPQKGGEFEPLGVVQDLYLAGRRPTEKPKLPLLAPRPAVLTSAVLVVGAVPEHGHPAGTVDNARRVYHMGMYGVPIRVLYGVLAKNPQNGAFSAIYLAESQRGGLAGCQDTRKSAENHRFLHFSGPGTRL